MDDAVVNLEVKFLILMIFVLLLFAYFPYLHNISLAYFSLRYFVDIISIMIYCIKKYTM